MPDNKTDENKKYFIHTLESDLSSAVMSNDYGKNIINIVTDPKNNSLFKTGNLEIKKNDIVKKIIIFMVFIFIVSAILTIVYIKSKNTEISQLNVDLPKSPEDNQIDPVNSDKPILKYDNILNPEILKSSNFSKLNRFGIVSEINNIKQVLLENKIAPNNIIDIDSSLDIRQLFEKINYSGDDSLLRSFTQNYSFGLYSKEKNQFETYILIELNNFDLAFKSTLDWEKYIPVDLNGIFIGNNEIVNTSISTTSTSSKVLEKVYGKADTKIFIDRVIKNYDVREYVNNGNNINIIYGFINNKFLLLTSGESSFLDIKNRLLKENISR